MTPPPAHHSVTFGISRLEAWAPGVTAPGEWAEWARGERAIAATGEPALQQMPAMLRRHAGRLGRLSCSPAYEALGELRDVPVVFSSRNGEVSRSVELLTALAAGDELSPTTFGLSVHNAVPGLFSMARKETANSVSIAASDDAAEYGVIEACGLLSDGASQVLLVVADCPLPPIYAQFEDTDPAAYGFACLVSESSGSIVSLEWSESDSIYESNKKDIQGALQVVSLLQGHRKELRRTSGSRSWSWSRHG